MKRKIISIVVTVLEVLIGVFCFVDSWARLKMASNYWVYDTFYDAAGWMDNNVAFGLVILCALIVIAMIWTSIRKYIVFPSAIQVFILLRTWYAVHQLSDWSGQYSIFKDGYMLPLGIIHCLIAVIVFGYGIRMILTSNKDGQTT